MKAALIGYGLGYLYNKMENLIEKNDAKVEKLKDQIEKIEEQINQLDMESIHAARVLDKIDEAKEEDEET